MKEGYGEFIKYHRIASGFKTQRRLAEKTGISPPTISRIEKEIQKPELRTLQTLAEYLVSTTIVDLMIACGYWSEEDSLKNKSKDGHSRVNELVAQYISSQESQNSQSNEEEFIEKIDLTDVELLEQFDLKVDGKSLTEEETKGIIAYIRSLRQMKS